MFLLYWPLVISIRIITGISKVTTTWIKEGGGGGGKTPPLTSPLVQPCCICVCFFSSFYVCLLSPTGRNFTVKRLSLLFSLLYNSYPVVQMLLDIRIICSERI